MREVLISIQPRWVEKIACGEKTVEVRKTRPNCELPFKCYIYCTQGKLKDLGNIGNEIYQNRMKVIGEFVCDRIDKFVNIVPIYTLVQSCLTAEQIREYLKGKNGYGWHITDLVVYDEPRELSEFRTPCKMTEGSCYFCDYAVHGMDGDLIDCDTSLSRPPQSWCYIEPRQTAD